MKFQFQLPEGWTALQAVVPTMYLPENEPEDPWQVSTTIKEDVFLLDLEWWPLQNRYIGRVVVNQNWEQPRETKALDYPHEVILWVTHWFQVLQRQAQP